MEARADEILGEYLPDSVLDFKRETAVTPLDKLKSYFLGGFGGAQRLEYGAGHELPSFHRQRMEAWGVCHYQTRGGRERNFDWNN